MTTITINEDIKLSTKDFNTYQDLVNFIIYDNTNLEIEDLTQEEINFIKSLDSFKNFRQIANLLWK